MSNLLEEVKNIRAKQAVSQGKVQKLVTAHGLKFKGKIYKEIDMELKGIDNNTEMVTFNIIHPPEIFGNEVKLAFKVLRRGPFMATDTSKIMAEECIDIENESEYTLDESKMKELAMRIADVYMQMKKDSVMKPFADRFRADVKRSLDIRKSLEKVLPDYVDGAKITAMMKEEETDEAMSPKAKAAAAAKARQDKKFGPGGSYSKGADAIRKVLAKKEDVEVTEGYFDEQKSSTGYDLYHKEFSGAMQHAYAHAKKKFGITIDPDEIDDKVATGPRKPSKGKTNSYKLKGDKGSVQIQVYNMGSRYELNMYKEEVEIQEKKDYKYSKNFFSNDQKDKLKDISDREGYSEIELGDYLAQKAGLKEPDDLYFDGNELVYGAKTIARGAYSKNVSQLLDVVKKIKEEVELDEITQKFAVIDPDGNVLAFASDEKDANSLAKNNLRKVKGKVVKLKRGIATNRSSKMIGRPLETGMAELDEDRRTELYHQSMMFTHAMKKIEFKKKDPRLAKQHDVAGKLHAKAADMHVDNHSDAKKHSDKANKASTLLGEEAELDEAQIAALTKANIKHTVKQHPMKRSKTIVNVSRKDYKAAEKALGKEASSQGDNIMLGISESVKFGGMPSGLSKKRIKADRDVYAQVLGIREALDPADFDISATSKDKEQADKNVILQLRKVISLNGTKPVEFSNGKKEKVHPNIASAALNIHRKLRRTDEKDAFQQKIAKSYRDLLNAVKGK